MICLLKSVMFTVVHTAFVAHLCLNTWIQVKRYLNRFRFFFLSLLSLLFQKHTVYVSFVHFIGAISVNALITMISKLNIFAGINVSGNGLWLWLYTVVYQLFTFSSCHFLSHDHSQCSTKWGHFTCFVWRKMIKHQQMGSFDPDNCTFT